MTSKEKLTREGLPAEAFAIAADHESPDTWKLPHHKRSIFRALRGKQDMEKTVDWEKVREAVADLSVGGNRRRRVEASPEQVLGAACIWPITTGKPISRFRIPWLLWCRRHNFKKVPKRGVK